MGFPQGDQPPLHLLNYMSINVGGGGTAYDINLARVCEFQFDVLFIQEPSWSGRTKSYHFYDCHLPLVSDEVRSRAVTYTRKDLKQINANKHSLPN